VCGAANDGGRAASPKNEAKRGREITTMTTLERALAREFRLPDGPCPEARIDRTAPTYHGVPLGLWQAHGSPREGTERWEQLVVAARRADIRRRFAPVLIDLGYGRALEAILAWVAKRGTFEGCEEVAPYHWAAMDEALMRGEADEN